VYEDAAGVFAPALFLFMAGIVMVAFFLLYVVKL